MAKGRNVSIAVIAASQVAAMTLWFSATAVIPALQAEHNISSASASLFTSAVQFGFVVGTLISAVFSLADRLDPRALFMWSALVAAGANAAILLVDPTSSLVILLRFVTGVCMAGVYPVGMKLASTWAKGDMGLLLGLLVGALTLGSAAPHLFNALGGIDWRLTLATGSIAALVAALTIRLSGIGPNVGKSPPFNPRFALAAWKSRPLRLANLGYLGHMLELYAMWAWIGLFLHASFQTSFADDTEAAVTAALVTFATIGTGALGCLFGGIFADRYGRTTLTIIAMAVSGSCALVVGFLFGGNPVLLTAVCLLWGISAIADSAQFSASIVELSDRSLVGTMLTVQTSMGFLVTLLTIHLLPPLVELFGWSYAFAVLAIGPYVGVLAMWRLRRHPESKKLARGRR
ncbi:MAG: MFS transporter [Methyloligellaceae bacterium]